MPTSILSLVFSALAVAPAAPVANTVAQQIKKDSLLIEKLERRFGAGAVKSITPTNYSGLLEVTTEHEVLYTDKNGNYFIAGHVFETSSGKDLTQETEDRKNVINFRSLPFDLAIKSTNGNGKRVIAIFEDPNCGYCKVLRKTLKNIPDVTIYSFSYNILTPESITKAANIWCAEDRLKTFDDWMLLNKVPVEQKNVSCKSPHEEILALGKKIRVKATPTMFFLDGTRAAGALKEDKLEERLKAIGPK